ncbi:hypothetical protein Hanom_Chr13g01222741 [Helianthus anomalus]
MSSKVCTPLLPLLTSSSSPCRHHLLCRHLVHLFSLQTADIWSTSSPADACRCGPQTADLFPQKKQTSPKCS